MEKQDQDAGGVVTPNEPINLARALRRVVIRLGSETVPRTKLIPTVRPVRGPRSGFNYTEDSPDSVVTPQGVIIVRKIRMREEAIERKLNVCRLNRNT